MTKAKRKPRKLRPVTYDDLPDDERIELEMVMKRFAEESEDARRLSEHPDDKSSSEV